MRHFFDWLDSVPPELANATGGSIIVVLLVIAFVVLRERVR